MALKKAPRRNRRDHTNEQIDDQPPVENRIVLIVALVVLLTSGAFAFLMSSPTGDTFMTLAGGRDVFDGKLAQPDDWSFNSEGRVWINQSWGTGVLYYTLWKQVGYVGIVIVKGVLICLLGLMLVLQARQFGTTYSVAMLVAAFILAAMTKFIDMRANAVGLTMLATLIGTLYWSFGHPHRIWLTVALLTIWAHMHGSFIFGIAVLGLWTVTNYGVLLWQGRRFDQLKRLWTLPVATVLALVLSAATSPFGITNVIQPFSLMGLFVEEEWPVPAREMVPIFADHLEAKTYAGTPWFLFMLGCLTAPFVLRAIRRPAQARGNLELDTGQRIKWVFTLLLTVITVAMAVKARRFMPIGLVVSMPLLAFELQRLFAHRWFAWTTGLAIVGSLLFGVLLGLIMPYISDPLPLDYQGVPSVDRRLIWGTAALVLALSPILGALVVAVGRRPWSKLLTNRPEFAAWIEWLTDRRRLAWSPMIVAAAMLVVLFGPLKSVVSYHEHYLDLFPSSPNDNIFERLVRIHMFPDASAEFLVANNIQGNVFCTRPWAGFLYWNHPKLKLMFGGRSRQVYSVRGARSYIAAGNTRDYSLHTKMGLSLATVMVADGKIPDFVLTKQPTPWRIIYYDGQSMITANQDIPESQQYILDARAGKLVYPSAKSALYSLAARRLVMSSMSSPQEILESTAAATKDYPTPQLYLLLLGQAEKQGGVTLPAIISFFESELVRLHGRDFDQTPRIAALKSRLVMSLFLANAAANAIPPQAERSEFWKKYARQIKSAINASSAELPDTYISEIPEEFAQLHDDRSLRIGSAQ